MNIKKQNRKVWSGALLGLSAVALAGSAHAAVFSYSNETFEGGTPNYTINGINGTGVGQSWDKLESSPGVEIFPADAMVGTGYDSGSSSRNGVVANSEPTNITPGGTIPTGQHGFVSTSANRNFSSNYLMTLASDGATSLDISLSYMFYSLSTDGNPVTAKGTAIIYYSALGDFSDNVELITFGFGQAGSLVETPDFAAVEDAWGSLSASFTEASAGITFTDTAALRINRAPLVGLVSPDTPTNHITFLDDIVVSAEAEAVPEPSSAALLGLAGCALLLRRRK